MRIRLLPSLATAVLLAGACGDDAPTATPEQAEAISTLIEADLSSTEQDCMLDGIVDSGIAPEAVIDGSLNGDQDAELLAVAIECIDDLSGIPAFVESFIEGAAAEGTTLTDEQAQCAIASIGEGDPTGAVADCLTDDTATATPDASTRALDLLTGACEGGNNQACDELYEVAPEGSEAFTIGRTCAGQLPDSIGLRCFLDLDT